MSVITCLSSFPQTLCCCFFSLFEVPLFLFRIGLPEFRLTSLALQAQLCVDKVWFHPLHYVCRRWPQDGVHELRLLSRRGEMLSEPSLSINVNISGRCWRATVPFNRTAPPSVSTRLPLSAFLLKSFLSGFFLSSLLAALDQN